MPRKPPKPSLKLVGKQDRLTVSAQFLNNWKLILGAIAWAIGTLVLAGWNARGHKDELATKAELKAEVDPVKNHVAAHDAELAGMNRAVSDTQTTVHQILDELLKRR